MVQSSPAALARALVAALLLSSLVPARRAHDRSLAPRAGPHHALAESVLHKKRDDAGDLAEVFAAIQSSLESVASQHGDGAVNDIAGIPIADAHQASMASAIMLVAKSSQNAVSAKEEGDREKALKEKAEKAAKAS